MKKSKFGNLNFDSVEKLSREELKKVTGGYTNCYNCDIYPTPPSPTTGQTNCTCLVQFAYGVNIPQNFISYNGSCYGPDRPANCAG
jgi:hypothetical protein